MAKKGIRYCFFGKYDAWSTEYYGNTKDYYHSYMRPSTVVTFNMAPNNTNAKDHGDDRVVEVENGTNGGTLNIELNSDQVRVYDYLLGHTLTGNTVPTKELTFSEGDAPNAVGVGVIAKISGHSAYPWVIKFYPKVVFSEPNDENQTKTDNVTFGHLNLVGELLAGVNDIYKKEVYVSSEEGALDYLKKMFEKAEEPDISAG